MSAEVVTLNCETVLDLTPERVLSAAIEAGLETVLVIGRDTQGGLHVASSQADAGVALVLMELAKRQVLDAIE